MSIKREVLKKLEENKGNYLSGETLAASLQVSRSAVWKAVKELQKEGYQIKAVTNSGYCFSCKNDILSPEGIACYLRVPDLYHIVVYKTVASTNEMAKKMAVEGAAHGTVVVANEQTAGRGRRGRSFFSPPDSGIYFSVLLRNQDDLQNAQLITTAAAVAVCRAIERIAGFMPKIKWVNDIFIEHKKVCGILTEASTDFESGQTDWVVLGIGINLFTPASAFPPDLRQVAGSLYDGKSANCSISRNKLLAEVLNHLFILLTAGASTDHISAYKSRSMLIGKEIEIRRQGQMVSAKAMDIDQNGGLVVSLANGEQQTLVSGEVSVRDGK